MGLIDREFKQALQHAWHMFRNKNPVSDYLTSFDNYKHVGPVSYHSPNRMRLSITNEKGIITTIYNKISVDVASTIIKHVQLDDEGRYLDTVNSDLNYCLTSEANMDQTSRSFLQDVAMSLFDEGVVAIVPIETDIDIENEGSIDIKSMRTGKILHWYPDRVKVNVYNELKGIREDIIIEKSRVAIIENPFYLIMNEQNSTAKRLSRKLTLLDKIDEKTGSDKLNMIMQLPFSIRSEAKKEQAATRLKEIEYQLTNNELGIAYTDATEKIIQLNRPLENQLPTQIEYLTKMLMSQLGFSEKIFNGTADEKELLNYQVGTIDPIISAIVDGMNIKFLTKTVRERKQKIVAFKDVFKFITLDNMANISDKLSRNEIVSSNEMRSVLGLKPSDDPRADKLINKNMPPIPEDPYEDYEEDYEEGEE